MAESHREEIAKLEALYASNPGGRVFVHLAEAYRRTGEHERARRILEDGLSRHTDSVSGYVVLGRVLTDLEETTAAEAAFRRVTELDEGNLIALRSLGDIARAADRFDEAAVFYGDALARNPSDAEVRALLGSVQRDRNVDAAAVADRTRQAADSELADATPDGGPLDPAWHVAPEWGVLESSSTEPVAPPSSAPGQIDEPGDSLAEIEFGLVELDALPGDLAALAGEVSDDAPAESETPAIEWELAAADEPGIETDVEALPDVAFAEPGSSDLTVAPLDISPLTAAPTSDFDVPDPAPEDVMDAAQASEFAAFNTGFDPMDDIPAEDGLADVGDVGLEDVELEEVGVGDVEDGDVVYGLEDGDVEYGDVELAADDDFDAPEQSEAVDDDPDAGHSDAAPGGDRDDTVSGGFDPRDETYDEVEADGPVYDTYTPEGFESSVPDGPSGDSPIADGADEAAAFAGDAGLNTETIADLYRSQGFHERAADIYRTLLQQRPEDERLTEKLRETERSLAPQSRPVDDESGDGWLHGTGAVWVRQDPAADDTTPYSWTSRGDEDPPSPPVRQYLQNLLGWRGSAEQATAVQASPAAAASPAEQATVEHAASTSGSNFPWDDSADEAVTPVASEPDPADTGVADSNPVDTESESDSPARETAPAPRTGDPVEDAFLDWYGDEPESVAAADNGADEKPASLEDYEEEADDEDLEMFRTWLKSLKK